jgi:hypothetical protein
MGFGRVISRSRLGELLFSRLVCALAVCVTGGCARYSTDLDAILPVHRTLFTL